MCTRSASVSRIQKGAAELLELVLQAVVNSLM